MAKTKSVRAATTSSLPYDLRIPSTTASLVRTLGKLSRQSLLELVLLWLSNPNVQRFPPFLAKDVRGSNENENDDEETSPYPAAHSVEDVRLSYEELQARKGGKREVIDRILEGDWRHGITLGQLAMADIRYLEDHPAAQKWTAFRLVPADNKKHQQQQQQQQQQPKDTDLSACLPRLHAATFLSNLQREISPLVKAHYHLAKSSSFPLTFLRIFVTDSPYQYPRHNSGVYLDSSRIIHIAFPDSSPFIYTSATTTTSGGNTSSVTVGTDSRALRSIVRNAIARALSKQHERYELEATSLTAKSLATLIALRGPGRTNNANGAFSIFADAVIEGTPIDPRRPGTVSPDEYSASGPERDTPEKEEEEKEGEGEGEEKPKRRPLQTRDSNDSPATKKRKLVVSSRFGSSGTAVCPAALDRLDARLLDRLDDDDNDNDNDHEPDDDDDEVEGYLESGEYAMGLSLTGNNVIAGLRKLAELGMVDPARMPSWMTGEEGVSSLVARRGVRVVPGRRRG